MSFYLEKQETLSNPTGPYVLYNSSQDQNIVPPSRGLDDIIMSVDTSFQARYQIGKRKIIC